MKKPPSKTDLRERLKRQTAAFLSSGGKVKEFRAGESAYDRNEPLPPAPIFEARRAELQKVADEKKSAAESRGEKVSALDITLTAKAGEEGKLFGSITVRDVAEAVNAAGVELEKSEVRLPEGPLRELGEFEIDIHLHTEVNVKLKLTLVPEE